MWTLKEIRLINIASFEEVVYTLNQGVTTLIFGNNLDNDSQGSNGSGKSALLEGISLALTGETLRKVKGDEIINDESDEAVVEAMFYNTMSGVDFLVTRILSRKNPQKITCQIFQNGEEIVTDETAQSSVAEYNKYILDKIGLSKGDIFGNFVLSKHKFTSFLSSSDKEKKEIINRFSNAIIVDDAIEALGVDVKQAEEVLREHELSLSKINGSIEAMETQLDNAKNNLEKEGLTREQRKSELNASIIEKKQALAKCNAEIRAIDSEKLPGIEKLIDKTCDLENSEKLSIKEEYGEILGMVAGLTFGTLLSDWPSEIASISESLSNVEKGISATRAQFEKYQQEIEEAGIQVEKAEETLNQLKEQVASDDIALHKELQSFELERKETEESMKQIVKKGLEAADAIALLKNKLSGTITCPKCQHRFVLAVDIDVDAAEREIVGLEKNREELLDEHALLKKDCESIAVDIEAVKKDIQDNRIKVAAGESVHHTLSSTLANFKNLAQSSNYQIDNLQSRLDHFNKKLQTVRENMFDEAYRVLDKEKAELESERSQFELQRHTTQANIETFQKSLDEIDTLPVNNLAETLEKQLRKYDLQKAGIEKLFSQSKGELNELSEQMQTFVEFKTHLANTKVEALSKITNEFLEKIGSDIQIKFSGYSVLKSGKIRDKISISLIRNGVDCGSFDKFSEGEKARVNLANILALNKLTNLNCEDGKGLDLLVLDEILEATDESGLANIFEALNGLKITSLVVSHGNVAENYPHKLLINKQNGISYVNDKQH